ncbi:MAG TPA: DUF1684 domain-containing protein [Thermoanaerobaculia bacterium]|jgi:hypothetical protein|nr:DUF1684 domain-containing protein [Thermoanaerobaculia bacterium]
MNGRFATAIVLTSVLAAAAACAPGRSDEAATPTPAPVATTAAAQQEQPMNAQQQAALDEWRKGRIERLTSPDGWLTLVGLEWLDEGDNTLGSAAEADVHFPAKAPANLGTISRHGEELTLTPAAGSPLTIDKQPVTKPTKLLSDAKGDPTVVSFGTIEFYVIQRGDRWAVRMKDSENPVRTGFKGLDYYPNRGDWVVTANFEPAPKGTKIPVPNILGATEETDSPGDVLFSRDGHNVRLQAIDEGDGRLFLVFGDQTNGKGTYGGGRFVYAAPPKPGEHTVTIDFNQAYNPPCVFTPYATCPLPPKGNKMPFPIEAGEKLWSGYHHPAG